MFDWQRTIKNSVACFGIGLHSGELVSMKLKPAPIDNGITFIRTDIDDSKNKIQASYNLVCCTKLSTTIANCYEVKISTIEHIMAALCGCGIDNIIIELNNQEVPIMDGSSEPFVFLLECAGVIDQLKPKKVIKILKEIKVEYKDAYAAIKPAEDFAITMNIDFNSLAINKQYYSFKMNEILFKASLCRARTFVDLFEVEQLKKLGLAKGGSLSNAIVVEGDKILNEGGLRYDDEFVRHKVLDVIGDLYLAGSQLVGHFIGAKSGHMLNNLLLRKIFSDSSAWQIVEQKIVN